MSVPGVRGTISECVDLAPYTWFRVGGPADVLFVPADADDLVAFLRELPADVPITALGVGSNVLVRDGGIRGAVIRLGGGFNTITLEADNVVCAGAGALDQAVSRRAQKWGLSGLEFLSGIPGTIGGALRMNAGAYGSEIKDILVSADVVDRNGERRTLKVDELGYAYRSSEVPPDCVFVSARFSGRPAEEGVIRAKMNEIKESREKSQPIRTRTGGSTFKNPVGNTDRKAWQLIDEAGCRGLREGEAQVSEMHCNFLINHGAASAQDLEKLGERVRQQVERKARIKLEWEIKRIGENVHMRRGSA